MCRGRGSQVRVKWGLGTRLRLEQEKSQESASQESCIPHDAKMGCEFSLVMVYGFYDSVEKWKILATRTDDFDVNNRVLPVTTCGKQLWHAKGSRHGAGRNNRYNGNYPCRLTFASFFSLYASQVSSWYSVSLATMRAITPSRSVRSAPFQIPEGS